MRGTTRLACAPQGLPAPAGRFGCATRAVNACRLCCRRPAADYPIERLSVSPDRTVLASASHDNSVKLWDLTQLAEGDEDDEDAGEEEAEEEEEAASEEKAEGKAGGDEQSDGLQAAAAGSGPAGQQHTAAPAAAAAPAGAGSSDSDDSDSDGGRRGARQHKRKKGQHKIQSKKQAKGGNFFSDLL